MSVLSITLFIILCANYYFNDHELVSPAFLFNFSFLLASVIAWMNEKKWNLILSINTYLVIVLGVTEFSIICYIVKKIVLKNGNTNVALIRDGNFEYCINSNYLKLISIVIVQLLNIVVIYYYASKITGTHNFSVMVNMLNAAAFTGNDQVSLPTVAVLATRINIGIGYWGAFKYAQSNVFFEKKKKIFLLMIILGMFSPLIGGYRGSTISLIIALIVYILLAVKFKYGTLKIKYFLYSLIIFLVVLLLWQTSAVFLGRSINEASNPVDYLSMYMGAEISNLNTFLNNGLFPVNNGIFGSQTFYAIIPTISRIFHLNVGVNKLFLPFQYINGISLGNVYTTFYPWIYDFGYIGVLWMVLFTGVISECIYLRAKKYTYNKPASISILLYGYIASLLILSFFSNKFWEGINTTIIYMIITWLVLNLYTTQSN